MAGVMVPVMCYFDGRIVMEGRKPEYVGGTMRPVRIQQSSNYDELKRKMYGLTGYDPSQFRILMTCRYPTSGSEYIAMEINDDDSTMIMLDLYPRVYSIELFMDKVANIPNIAQDNTEPVGPYRHMLDDSMLKGDAADSCSYPSHSEYCTRSTLGIPDDRTRVGQPVGSITSVRSSHGQSDNVEGPSSTVHPASAETCDENIAGDVQGSDHKGDDVQCNDVEGDSPHDDTNDLVDKAVANNNLVEFEQESADEFQTDECVERMVSAHVDSVLRVGQVFEDKDMLKQALEDYSIRRHVEYKVLKSGKIVLTVLCVNKTCPWRVHASKIRGLGQFQIKRYKGPHTCINDESHEGHRQCSASFISNLIMPTLKAKPTMTPVEIQQKIKDEYHVKVSYGKAWQAKNLAMNSILGDWEKSYTMLPCYLKALQETNPGTVVHFLSKSISDNQQRFKRLFWSFGPAVMGFSHCRPVLSINGSHLYGRYVGSLLIATAIDGDNGLFPLAFAVVESEKRKSWEWFLTCIRQFITNKTGLTIISDCKSGLQEAVESVFPPPTAVHRYCMRHLVENFKNRFNDPTLMNLFLSAAQNKDIVSYDEAMKMIFNMDPAAHTWIQEIGSPALWSLAHDEGKRFGVLTTNMSEIFNSVLKGVRGLPIQALIAKTFRRLNKLFVKRRERGVSLQTELTPRAEEMLRQNELNAKWYNVVGFSCHEFQVIVANCTQFTVSIGGDQGSCTCNEFQLLGIPCSHAVAACKSHSPRISHYNLCSSWYRAKTYMQTYASPFHPVMDKQLWPDVQGPSMIPPNKRRRAGRPDSVRLKTGISEREGHSTVRCSRCKQPGHNKAKCPHPPSPSAT